MRRGWLVFFIATGIAAACANESDIYVYTARRYSADGGCLDPYKSIDVVHGDSVSSTCAPICFQYGGETFTSTVCPPLPDLAVGLDAQAPECVAANGLYMSTCGTDAGETEDEDAAVPLDASDDGG
jgi:hypothetical protein